MLLTKPVIAAVAGHAVAGGLELACWCDLRVVEEDAVFGVFCRRWGVPLIDGGTIRLPRLIGSSRALDMILTGRPARRSPWGSRTGWCRPDKHAARRNGWHGRLPRSHKTACATIGGPCTTSSRSKWTRPFATSSPSARDR